MKLSVVPVGNITALVPQLVVHLQTSARGSRGRSTPDDILRSVLAGQMQLWAVHEGQEVHGFVATEIKQYPRCRMFVVQHCAMTPGTMAQVEAQMHELADAAARAAGCAGIEFIGRPGWRAAARKYGYATESVSYQKFFEVQQ